MIKIWHHDVLLAQRFILENTDNLYYGDKYMTDESHYWYHIPYYMSLDAVENRVDNVLDVGCGYGTLLKYARDRYTCNCYGFDMVDNLSDAVKEKIPMTFVEGNIELDELPFGIKFDRIIFTEIFEHLLCCPIHTLNKLVSVLSPEGKVFLSTPNAASWGPTHTFYKHFGDFPKECSYIVSEHNFNEHIYHYSEGEIRYIIDKAGLKIDKMNIYQPPTWGSHFNMQLSKK